MKRVKDRGGFIFVEALIASGVFVVVGGAVVSLFIYGSNLWQLVITQNELRSGASTAIYQMTKDLQNATPRASPSSPPPSLTIPTSSSITFYLPDPTNAIRTNADGSSDWDLTPIQYQYVPASKQLSRSTPDVSKVICNNVASVKFEDSVVNTSLPSDELKIILKVEKNTLMGIKSTTVTSIIKLRN
ncbi:MAG: hypothetical protein NTY34_06660 [Candidatus Omnitrophica bacterium]|nr:hypothetical protein [Candidatus Omnitrophota bacterium]